MMRLARSMARTVARVAMAWVPLPDLLKPGVSVGDRACDLCGLRTTRIGRAQYAAFLDDADRIRDERLDRAPVVPCWCGGTLRELLVLAANTVHPTPDGLDRIRARTTSTPGAATPGADQATPTDQTNGEQGQ